MLVFGWVSFFFFAYVNKICSINSIILQIFSPFQENKPDQGEQANSNNLYAVVNKI